MEPDAWNDVYDIPFDYHIDYNAKRLAVTSTRHAAWGATIAAGMKNPYAEFFHWELTPAHVIFDICDAHAYHEEGLGEGNFPLDAAPLPHPWCTCLWYVDTLKSLEEIGQELRSWADGERSDARLDEAFGVWEQSKMGWNQARKAGRIDPERIAAHFGAVSEDVIITDERIEHIKAAHGADFDRLYPELSNALAHPDYILMDWKNEQTAFFIKEIAKGGHINAVVRFVSHLNTGRLDNSVITFYPLGDKTLKRMLKKAISIYTK